MKKKKKPKNKIENNKKKTFWRFLKLEIRDSITSHIFKIIRFLGILFIPFIYGFVYIFAFQNPLKKTRNLDFDIIVSKTNKNDIIMKKLTLLLNNDKKLDIHFNMVYMDPEDIYKKTDKFFKEVNKHYASLIFKPVYDKDVRKSDKKITKILFDNMKDNIEKIINAAKKSSKKEAIEALKTAIIGILRDNASKINGMFDFYINSKKNFLIAFGVSTKLATQKIYKNLITAFFGMDPKEINNILFPEHTEWQPWEKLPKEIKERIKNHFNEAFALFSKKIKIFDKKDFLISDAQMKEHSTYGFGLSPFFISLGLWVGAIAACLFITGQVHRKKEDKIKLYFTKMIIILNVCVIQTSILFLALLAIGFYNLGPAVVFMWFTSIIISWLFANIVFSIRLMIPSRVTGIITTVFLLIIQIGASGGLFPLFSQFKLFQVIHYIMPLSYSVNLLRESMFDINGFFWLINLIRLICLSFPFLIMGPLIYSKRKNKIEKINNVAIITKGVN